MSTLRFELDAAGVALVSIDVVDRSMNVLTPALEAALAAAVERIAADASIKAAVITSAKSNAFLAGADLKELVSVYGQETLQQAYARSARLSGVFRRLETCGKPIAAAINGLALGGGLELALACHYRVLADDPKAVVGLPEVKVGLLPGAGGTQRLPRLIGIQQALPMLLNGAPVLPAQALELGIVHALAPADQLIARARDWVLANPVAQQPWDVKGFKVPGGVGCLAPHAVESFQAGTSRVARATQRNYPAPPAILACVFEGTQLPIDRALRLESKYFATLLCSPVCRNLMRTMFIQKEAADKLASRPAGVPKSTFTRIGVIGAGMMGAGIAYAAASAGIDVILLDATQELADRGKAYSVKALQRQLEKRATTQQRVNTTLSRILATTDYSHLRGCELVVEAVFEKREVKHDVIRKATALLGPSAIFASNTSTLPIGGLAEVHPRPEQFVGLHFFSPVEHMPLVEVIRGRSTSAATLAQALDFVSQLRKTPIVVNDSPGFFTSRVFGTYVDEGMAMLAEGIEPALIENAARMAGMPVGPLAVCDEVTIELQLKVHEQAVADGLNEKFQRLTAIDVVRKMVQEQGRVGRRGGGGFYDYPANERKRLWPGLRDLFAVREVQPEVEELRQRFLVIQALESARCVAEGVIDRPADADLGSILGIGYPAWAGGVLSFIDTIGAARFIADCRELARRYGQRFEPPADLVERAHRSALYHEETSGFTISIPQGDLEPIHGGQTG
ncbi:3-hydroxyacyl-CoA dehydrogenase [Steroidobacter agaridevorans]|uniref:3-hydroxyacyl-CoA dehydrogenase n=1 Tax=Steroidobacter agaridevorans TaxID=2695856 RepID=A0A829YGS2_9GAMM|nr:3-hydroxyacyl-CoA dehydrogenase NAD-binding domain-containing protein [Steroidobacter agaridevorans]GFE82517.1 3-hydroxyacyl-CoA dehydrogenase [Steroidobacter agaridevorans]